MFYCDGTANLISEKLFVTNHQSGMKYKILLSFIILSAMAGRAQQQSGTAVAFDQYPVYTGKDLGLTYSPEKSFFRLWAPMAMEVRLMIYSDFANPNFIDVFPMKKEAGGTWTFTWKGDHKGKLYAFSIYKDMKWGDAVPDPYAKAVALNGKRAVIIDLKETNPSGWEKDKSPSFTQKTDAVIYELQVRDASIAASSGIRQKGLFNGLAETGTRNPGGFSTGLDHIRDLGVTHVHLLPVFDFNSIDESLAKPNYNWGYDPLNYNVPEGSFSSNAYDPITRIRELKNLVKTFHDNGLRVVMDVVYNHTSQTESSLFNQLVPGYYYRQQKDGRFSNASACGNETASERPMMRKFILESMKYWVQEYHIDGFRIDLMGIHDIETINLISKELHQIKPGILLYGEGWTAGASPLPDNKRAIKANAARLDRVAVFSDDIRDGIKGSVFEHADPGFASGKPGTEESIKFGIVAACKHPQVDYSKVNYSKKPYAAQPFQTITYCECHDNHVLWDKLALSMKDATEEERRQVHLLSLSIVLSSQGISFLHAGTEFLRSKKGVENSFESPDSINQIDWNLKTKNQDIYLYTRALIRMRQDHRAFRLPTAALIGQCIRFQTGLPDGVIAYTIDGAKAGDSWKKVLVCFNGTNTMKRVAVGSGNWISFIRNNQLSANEKIKGALELSPRSCSIIYIK